MPDALIGHTGFVGGNLARQRQFSALYNSKNIDDIRGQSFDTVICAGAPGAKWQANANPDDDRVTIERLMVALWDVKATRFILISTVDVFAVPREVDENSSAVMSGELCPYGRHRLWLENHLRDQYGDKLTIVRLPALFGPGMKKNAFFDLMTRHETEKIALNATYQWYPVARLTTDLGRIVRKGLPLVHLCSTPLRMDQVHRRFFADRRMGRPVKDPPTYDVRTIHEGFRLRAKDVFREMGEFLDAQGVQRPH